MQTNRFFGILGLLTILSQISVAQSSITDTEQITGKPVYNKASGEKIPDGLYYVTFAVQGWFLTITRSSSGAMR